MHCPLPTLKVLYATALMIGCGGGGQGPLNDLDHRGIHLEHQRLSAATGISADPDSKQRYVLDGETGIFELSQDGQLILLWERPTDLPVLTDLCAIGGGRFIAAADGDGYVIDTASGAARQHFCLEPGWDPGFEEDVRHLNRAGSCDLDNRVIYGQPRTVPREGAPLPLRAEIARYAPINGEDLQWVRLPDDTFYAGGMTIIPGGRLLLATGTQLSIFNLSTERLVPHVDLAYMGIQDIAGLAFHPDSGRVSVLDDRTQRLHTLGASEINLPE